MAVYSSFRTLFAKSNFIKGKGILSNGNARSIAVTASCMLNQRERSTQSEAVERRLEPAEAENMMDIGIRGIFNHDHDLLRRSVRKFVQEEVVPQQRAWEQRGYPDREIFKQGAKAGICGLACPIEDHGLGGSIKDESIVWDEFCYGNSTVCGGFYLTNSVVLPYIVHYGTAEQKAKYIPRIVNEGFTASIAMTEPGAGSDLQGIQTTAKQDGDDWIINGSKIFISNGYNCNVCVVVAKTGVDASRPAHGISLFFVEEGTAGFVKGKPMKKLGAHGSDTSPLFFDEVRVPKECVLGEVNKGFYYMMNMLPFERLLSAGMNMGLAEYMFETTRSYVKERKAFGRTLANLQVIQHKLAEMKTYICVSRAFMDQCIEAGHQSRLDGNRASMVKYWVTDMANRVGNDCVQLHGGSGYMEESAIARAFATARAGPIYAGANEIMKDLISRQILKT